jgi:hypothetical protein
MLLLPKVEDVFALKDYINNTLNEFKADNNQFHIDFKKQNEIIYRYDEVLTLKAS